MQKDTNIYEIGWAEKFVFHLFELGNKGIFQGK